MIQLAMEYVPPKQEPTSKPGRELLGRLLAGERHTVATALSTLGIYALSQRVGELKRMGWPVQSRTITTPSGKHIKEYWI